ncbi:CDP-glycerol glycerophosphotransferase family protein [Agrobacterium sp. rho-13.3]|uniref:CDP-glycerol glycerophosphotransferase family protein n=1 Tax=Agrobacterium sp. rho-13.3 TaxID=3072980 RepID=UPI002A0D1010|nr:CDP-glycerol glycerophosphotransferase family protein [Agrobacterium sp. rho-13.3]MDX8308635.1 CDP-glycerol glycerophosphotransferase family protein [Agrobacterium sp. rho-13.3]
MDASISLQLTDRLDSVAAKIDEMGMRLDALMQNAETHGEIQIEVVKLLQHMQHVQLELDGKVTELSNAVTTTADGSFRSDLSKIGLAFIHDSRQKALEIASLKQSANIALRDQTRGIFPIRTVFLIQSIPMWDALSDVYDAMVADDRFDPIIISIHVATLGRGVFEGEDKVSSTFSEKGIPHLRFNMDDSYAALDILKALKPAVIFRQQQWDMGVQPAFRTQELTFSRLCYVPYALSLAASLGDPVVTDVSAFGFDQPFHRAAWRIFCETPKIQEYFRSFEHSDPKKFITSGFPKFDRLLDDNKAPSWPISHKDRQNFKVVWAPHYSLGTGGGLGFGVFDRIWESMLSWAKQSPDIDFVLKPHPALFGSVLSPEARTIIRNAWNDLPNCTFSEEQYGQLFAASDLMISDGLSFLAEYHLFNKPLVFFDSQNHVEFNGLGKLAEAASRRVTTFDQLKHAVLEYKDGKVWEFEEERKALLDNILPHRGKASAVILDTIAEGIRDGLN